MLLLSTQWRPLTIIFSLHLLAARTTAQATCDRPTRASSSFISNPGIKMNPSISLQEVNNGSLTGKSILSSELFRENNALIVVVRRPG